MDSCGHPENESFTLRDNARKIQSRLDAELEAGQKRKRYPQSKSAASMSQTGIHCFVAQGTQSELDARLAAMCQFFISLPVAASPELLLLQNHACPCPVT